MRSTKSVNLRSLSLFVTFLGKGSKETGPAHADFVMIRSLSIFFSFLPRGPCLVPLLITLFPLSASSELTEVLMVSVSSFLVRKVLGLRKLCGQLPYFLHVKINPAVATNTF